MSELQHGFDEALVSGYLDGELTQGEEQRVRLHLENCARCRNMADELQGLKEATMSTQFRVPDDTQWDEKPRAGASRIFRNAGWLIGLVCIVGTLGYVLWQVAIDAEDPFGWVLIAGFALASILVVLSVLIDRLKTRKTDRYRRVQR